MEKTFTCIAQSLIYSPNLSSQNVNRLENSNKVILNNNILQQISKKIDTFDSPMIFKLSHTSEIGYFESYVGVHDFSAIGETVYLPQNIMDDMFITSSSQIKLDYFTPPKGSYIKLRPLNENFYEIQEVKEVLEKNIVEHYPVLEKHQTISFKYLDKTVKLVIDECLPYDVISTNNTDLEVDFAEIRRPKPPEASIINNLETPINNINTAELNEISSGGLKTSNLTNEEVEVNCINSTNPRVRAFLENRRRRRAMQEGKNTETKTLQNNSKLGYFQGKGHKLGD